MTALADALRAADAVADAFLVGKHVPGLAYGVIVDGELVHSRGIGTIRVGEDAPPDADSVFRIASMTKSFTAATVISLRDEGRLALDDPIARYVPELAELRGPTRDSPVITIRHLLTMASGLATDDPWGDRQQGLDLAAFSDLLRGDLTFAWTPGTRFEYSNLGYGILGRLITNVAGAEYREVVRQRLLDPLGMRATTYLQSEVPADRLAHGYVWRDDAFVEEPMDPYGALASMGGVFTSIRDLARWIGFFTDAYPPRDGREQGPLSRASRREMQQAAAAWGPSVTMPNLDVEPEIVAGGYGFGLFVEDHIRWGRIVGHSGGYPGFGSNMRWQPASGLGVAVVANHRYAPSSPLARDLMASLLAAGAVPARRMRPSTALIRGREAIERLMAAWDDGLAASIFAMNVDLDEPLDRRRAELERIRAAHAALHPDPDLPEQSETPLHAEWWLADDHGGRVRVEILLSPEGPPRVQTFRVTSVPAPSESLRASAAALVAAINGRHPAMPTNLDIGPDVDRPALDRIIGIVAARHAPLTLGPATAGDGTSTTTWRLRGNGVELDLALTLDADGERLTAARIAQRPPISPSHGD
ncbi:MAG: class A beta-lactamase-related serine hydrolase [Chloroflexota bacterium]|nr:MAG: class A beta-lactamase-related serine hydrolase [Chloroflexota bacterium]